LSYARLVTPRQTSDGKVTGHGGGKIGNVHLKWAYSEAVLWMLRNSDDAKAFLKRMEITQRLIKTVVFWLALRRRHALGDPSVLVSSRLCRPTCRRVYRQPGLCMRLFFQLPVYMVRVRDLHAHSHFYVLKGKRPMSNEQSSSGANSGQGCCGNIECCACCCCNCGGCCNCNCCCQPAAAQPNAPSNQKCC
jgi:hypothetical protein